MIPPPPIGTYARLICMSLKPYGSLNCDGMPSRSEKASMMTRVTSELKNRRWRFWPKRLAGKAMVSPV